MEQWTEVEYQKMAQAYHPTGEVGIVTRPLGRLYYATVKVAGVPVEAMVDTGSSATIMSFASFKEVRKAAKIPREALKPPDHSATFCFPCTVAIYLNSHPLHMTFFVSTLSISGGVMYSVWHEGETKQITCFCKTGWATRISREGIYTRSLNCDHAKVIRAKLRATLRFVLRHTKLIGVTLHFVLREEQRVDMA